MHEDFCINVLDCGNYAMPNSKYCYSCNQAQREAWRKDQKKQSVYIPHADRVKEWEHKKGKK